MDARRTCATENDDKIVAISAFALERITERVPAPSLPVRRPWWRDNDRLVSLGGLLSGLAAVGALVIEIVDRI